MSRFDLKSVEFEFFRDCEEIDKKSTSWNLPFENLLESFGFDLYGKSRKGGRRSSICAKLICYIPRLSLN